MELTELRYFFHVATTRSFSKGAQLSHISPPAISKAVKKLEEELGTKLLQRSTRSVTTTASGEVVLESCRRVLAEVDNLRTELDEMTHVLRGELRVGAMEVFNAYSLPVCLGRLVREHSALRPRAYVLDPSEIVGGLLQGALDIGFAIGDPNDPRIDSKVLVTCPGSLVCGPGHPLYKSGEISEADLDRFPFVTQEFYQKGHLGPIDKFPDHLYTRRVGATMETLNMGIQLAVEGAFLGYFPNVAIHCQLNHGELKALTGLEPGGTFELCALTAAKKVVRPGAKLLSEHMLLSLEDLLVADCAVEGAPSSLIPAGHEYS